ncbi:MAG: family 20 glycosylhydrolase [Clostridia bacterium]|nr:family 20 glycosylhydrolase [Clostridia bacterium]
MIIPIVKRYEERAGVCAVPQTVRCAYDGELGRLGAEALISLLARGELAAEDAFVRFSYDGTLEERDEIYRLRVSAQGIHIGYRDARGAVNGAMSAVLLLCKAELACCEIVDYPACGYRSFLLDMARGLPTEEEIKSAIRYMALAKYNRLHLHLMDDQGPCFLSEAVPEYRFIGKGGQCSTDFLRELDALCQSYAIEIVPEIEIPAHATALCEAHPEFKCKVENAHSWAICPGNEDIWPFFDALVGEIAGIFPRSEYIHVGSDELEFRDLKQPRYCHWADCPRCAALRAREGLADRQAEFYYVMERIHGIVKSYGKKMMMWNDQIDVSGDVPLSRDILIEFWRVAGKGRGPHEGCSFEKLLEKGFRVVNAAYPYTYFDIESYMSVEKLKTWTPYTKPDRSPQYNDRVIGGESCAWEFGNGEEYPFYSYVTPPVLAMFGDKLWDLSEREYGEAYREALAEFVFGTAELEDVFTCVGALIPPRKGGPAAYVAPATLPEGLLERCIQRLEEKGASRSLAARRGYAGYLAGMLRRD